jgi:4'-phosphopantetheinyl transferase
MNVPEPLISEPAVIFSDHSIASIAPRCSEPFVKGREVHVWWTRLDASSSLSSKLYSLLSTDECARAARFRFEAYRRRYIAARGILRIILAKYLTSDPAEIRLWYGPYGKPYLINTSDSTLIHFNLSHSGDVAVYALCGSEIGIDIEQVDQNVEILAVARHFCTPGEVEHLLTSERDSAVSRFFQLWTSKEACVKALGYGLSLDLTTLQVFEGKETSWKVDHGDQRLFLYTLDHDAGYASAFAASGPIERVRLVDFQP